MRERAAVNKGVTASMTPFADRKVRRGRFLSVRKFFAQKGAEKANAVLEIRMDKADEQRIGKNL